MIKTQKTIFALSSPQTKSAIALIRISGSLAYASIEKISLNMPKKPNVATFNILKSLDGGLIDQTITTFFKAPKSFTGEDMVEVSIHGSPAVIKKIYEVLLKTKNLRIALPGEFTRRAFENNKLDLTQVEAISDIVNAETEMQRKQAISHLSGDFFKKTKIIFEDLKKITANIEAIIDFSEEELPTNLLDEIKEQIQNIINKIEKTLRGKSSGISIRSGFLVTLFGEVNAGKSSFINNISGRDIAIVTNLPGTTRDVLESFVDVSGYPVRFFDTAGIRKSKNKIEKIGVEKAILASKEADINVVFINKKEDIHNFKDVKNSIFVKSKQDLSSEAFKGLNHYNISSKNNFGIADLLKVIRKKLEDKNPTENNSISRERHAQALSDTLFYLKSTKVQKNIDIFAEDIRQSLKSISSLFGGVDIEDILEIVFSDFCIGK